MNREPCPRCGADRPVLGPCPECGYEDPHPGVLGAYGEAFDEVKRQPRLLVPFLVPVVVVLATQALLTMIETSGQVVAAPEVAAGLTALFLQAGWYFVVVGGIVPAATGDEETSLFPEGPVYTAAAQAAGLVVLPWALLATILLVQPADRLGALALAASLVLAIAAVVAVGRAIGLPVEAARTRAQGLELFRRGNERARENGGLGLAFLAMLALLAAFVVPAIGLSLTVGDPGQLWTIALGSVTSWLVGAWAGTAFAIGLAGPSQAVEETFTCPMCGGQARAQAGRARCECGLEGPYYAGGRG